jgi:hypothetical protein
LGAWLENYLPELLKINHTKVLADDDIKERDDTVLCFQVLQTEVSKHSDRK